MVLAATVNPRTTKHFITGEEQRAAVKKVTSEVSRLNVPQTRCVVIGKRHQGKTWVNSAETYVTPELKEAVTAVSKAVYDGKDMFHVQIVLPGHSNAPLKGSSLKMVTWDAEKFDHDHTVDVGSIKPSKTKQYVNEKASQVMLLLAQPPVGSVESIQAEQKKREVELQKAQEADGFEPQLKMPLPQAAGNAESALELKKLTVGNDPKVRELIERFAHSDKHVSENLTDSKEHSGYNLGDEAQREKLARHVYKNLGSPNWVRAQGFLRTMTIPKLLYEAIRKVAREEEEKHH